MIRVLQVELADAGDVGRDADVVVGDADRGPDRPLLLEAGAEDLEVPDLFRVGDGDAFAGVAVAVLLDQLAGQLDGLAGGGAAFEHQPFQLLDHEHAGAVEELAFSADGRLTDGQLALVQAGIGGVEEGISGCHIGQFAFFRNIPKVRRCLGVHFSHVDLGRRAVGVLGSRDDIQPLAVIAVAGMRRHDRTVGRGQAADLNTRAPEFRFIPGIGLRRMLGK